MMEAFWYGFNGTYNLVWDLIGLLMALISMGVIVFVAVMIISLIEYWIKWIASALATSATCSTRAGYGGVGR